MKIEQFDPDVYNETMMESIVAPKMASDEEQAASLARAHQPMRSEVEGWQTKPAKRRGLAAKNQALSDINTDDQGIDTATVSNTSKTPVKVREDTSQEDTTLQV